MMDSDLYHQLHNADALSQWKKVGIKHHHGIALPLFSLHTEKSTGIGEFLDLIPLIDYCKEIGFDVIQLLPINDTAKGTSPYSAISAFALNPIHISLWALPEIEKVENHEEKLKKIRLLTHLKRVDYEDLFDLKMAFLRDYVKATFENLSRSEEYQIFLTNNLWLDAYSLYMALKTSQNYASWESWPIQIRSPSQEYFAILLEENKNECDFFRTLQFHAFHQMKEVKKAADTASLFIKGDIPILTARDSADVWSTRQYFLLSLAAGAPPDMYSREGQTWGFPLYDWNEIEKENYNFWETRLKVASELYHLYRVDHVVGLFRLWSIPIGRKAKEGSFLPENVSDWIPLGKKILQKFLSFTDLLPIAEDLGTIPPAVRTCLKELGIPGTKVIRWERRWNEDGSFIPLSQYDPISMTTVSTHDSDTLALWWRHSPKEAKAFAKFKGWQWRPFLTTEEQGEIIWDSHHSASLFHINLFQEYLALFPDLVSPHLIEERINIPGKVLDTNWTYRFRTPLETIVKHEPLKKMMQMLSKEEKIFS